MNRDDIAALVFGSLFFTGVFVVIITLIVVNPDNPKAPPAPVCEVPKDAVCWCVTAKGDKVYVQEVSRPNKKEGP